MSGAELDVNGDEPTFRFGNHRQEEYQPRPFTIFLLTDLPDSPNEPAPEWIDSLKDEYRSVPDVRFVTAGTDLYENDGIGFHDRRKVLTDCERRINRADAILYRFTGQPSYSELLQLGMTMTTDRRVTDGNVAIWNDSQTDTSRLEQWLPTSDFAKETAEKDGNDTPITYDNPHQTVGQLMYLHGGYEASFLSESRSPSAEMESRLAQIGV